MELRLHSVQLVAEQVLPAIADWRGFAETDDCGRTVFAQMGDQRQAQPADVEAEEEQLAPMVRSSLVFSDCHFQSTRMGHLLWEVPAWAVPCGAAGVEVMVD